MPRRALRGPAHNRFITFDYYSLLRQTTPRHYRLHSVKMSVAHYFGTLLHTDGPGQFSGHLSFFFKQEEGSCKQQIRGDAAKTAPASLRLYFIWFYFF